jgi:hypothetical protein
MSSVKEAFGSSNQAITITLTSLANGSAQQSTVIDNSSNLFLDALVAVNVTSAGSGTVATGVVNVYAYATVDGGTTYTESATGSNASITLKVPTNLKFLGSVAVSAVSTLYNGGPFSVREAFGGTLPEKWGIVIENKTGGALHTSGNSVVYQGVYNTVA